MRGPLRRRLLAVLVRIRRLERREVRDFRRWLENTQNLRQLSVLLLVPLVLGLVTHISNAVSALPFLLFPPLASGAYTLFSQPESKYASPRRFVGGLTAGAVCGWASLELVLALGWGTGGPGFAISPGAVTIGMFLTGFVTWLLDVEEASAFSAALLLYVTDFTQTSRELYVLSVFLSSAVVAGVFYLWREEVYEQRAQYLYESTKGDDHVLVPMRTGSASETAMLGARLAAAHDAGKVVLLDIVDHQYVAAAERDRLADETLATTPRGSDSAADTDDGDRPADGPDDERVAAMTERLEAQAAHVETRIGVPCEVVVAVDEGGTAETVVDVAHRTNCDLVATPYEERHGSLSPFVRGLFRGDVDVLVHRSQGGRTEWRHVMVPVRRAGDVAHAMLDFALRLAGLTGQVGVCSCIGKGGDRRDAEAMLSDLVEPFDGPIETRVSRSDIESFLAGQAPGYDLVVMGASMDRSAASRFISPPTFERIQDLECDVAIVDRNFR